MTRLTFWYSLVGLTLGTLPTYAQTSLAGTAWQATVNIPDPTPVVFYFKQDTLLLLDPVSKYVYETMTYKHDGKQVTWQKVSGNSPCDTEGTGIYAYQIKKEQLLVRLVADPCPARSGAFTGKPLTKIVWPTP
jgi:hypothetical protein